MGERTLLKDYLVCGRMRCSECKNQCVPTECPYGILHMLGDDYRGIKEMPRRSGKTTKLIINARKYAEEFGKDRVALILRFSGQKKIINEPELTVLHIPVGNMNHSRFCLRNTFLFFDEYTEEEIEDIMKELPNTCVMVAGYYSSNPFPLV